MMRPDFYRKWNDDLPQSLYGENVDRTPHPL